MVCLKGLTALILTHVRLTPQVDVPFDAVAISISIFVHMEASTLIRGRTLSLTSRAHVIGTPKPRHVWTTPVHTLSSHGARFSCSLNPRAPGPIIGVLGPRPAALSSALYPSGTMVWVWLGPR